MTAMGRRFILLQGPHGPFFSRLAEMLRESRATVWRVGFNSGDAFFTRDKSNFIAFNQSLAQWESYFENLCEEKGVTDLVLYGDMRPVHAQAIKIAKARGITVHVFEEGYLRPYWVTYERDGVNGNSRLMKLSLDAMTKQRTTGREEPEAPAVWGDMRQHIAYGAIYHWFVMAHGRRFPHFASHRSEPLWREAVNYSTRLVLIPFSAIQRGLASRKIRRSGHPFHLALMQLEHDANFQAHGPFSNMEEFIKTCIEGFAKGAPAHHLLVFKAHPLDSGSSPNRALIKKYAQEHNVLGRVVYVRGGKLAKLLDHAKSAITVNSTAGQQALWRGIPLKAFGEAVYAKPPLVSAQPLEDFFANPGQPRQMLYRQYRQFLLQTSQQPGGYYSRKGRTQLLRKIVDTMLAPDDPYEPQLRAPTTKYSE